MKCATYGVLVNKGGLDSAVPCPPPQTWYKCSRSGCFGEPTGTCKCEKTNNVGYAAIIYDLTKNALFFAESDLANPHFVKCGDNQKESANFRQFMNSKLRLEQCPHCGVPKRVTVGCSPFASCPTGYNTTKFMISVEEIAGSTQNSIFAKTCFVNWTCRGHFDAVSKTDNIMKSGQFENQFVFLFINCRAHRRIIIYNRCRAYL